MNQSEKIALRNSYENFLKNSKNLQAFLNTIGFSEGAKYNSRFGGGTFTGYADHPRVVINKSGYKSSAHGKYQFLIKTWDECKNALDLPDFSPHSQDLAAIYLISRRKALNDVLNGNLKEAFSKLSYEWASFPPSRYGQLTKSYEVLSGFYVKSGGLIGKQSVKSLPVVSLLLFLALIPLFKS